MISKQARRVAGAIAPVLVLAACSSGVSGSGTHASGASSAPATGAATTGSGTSGAATSGAATSGPATSGTSSNGGTVGGFPTDAARLGALLLKGGRSIKSAHLRLTETVGTTSVSGDGDELLSNGKLLAMDLSEKVPGAGTLQFRIVSGRVFAKLPAAVYPSAKPWVEINPRTTNTALRKLYTSFQNSTQTGAWQSVQLFVGSARDLRLRGTEMFDGVKVARYSLSVDVPSLPADFPNRAALEQSGLAKIPIELYVDSRGRTRKVTEAFSVSGQHVDLQVTLTKIDVRVNITAPPARQVSLG